MHRFSLIVPTIGRAAALDRLLSSLCAQTRRDFEVIIVDQSQSADIKPVVAAYKEQFPILHIQSSEKGASRARNLGLKSAKGEFIAWPDDDCTYAPNLVEQVGILFDAHPEWGGISVCRLNETGQHDSRLEPEQIVRLKLTDFFFMAGEAAIFYRRSVITVVGEFDPYLGIGAGTPWGAGEAVDFQIRAYRQGFQTWFIPDLHIYHPSLLFDPNNSAQIAKLASYARGMGAVLRKQRLPFGFVLAYMGFYLLSPVRALTRLQPGVARVGWQRLLGLIDGWKNYQDTG